MPYAKGRRGLYPHVRVAILGLLGHEGYAEGRQMSELIAMTGRSRRAVNETLIELREEGHILRVGQHPNYFYFKRKA